MQLGETSTINDYDTPDDIQRDISCNLGSLNIANVMENKEIEEAVRVGMRALTQVSDMTDIGNAPTVQKANEELHSVGLGAMNLHGYLAKNKVHYDSETAVEFVNTFFMLVNFYSIMESMQIARERNETFKDFDHSDYANGEYFRQYRENDYRPVSDKVVSLFEGIQLPSPEDWANLSLAVQKFGLFHAYRLAIAPTQSIGYVQNATPSVMPATDHIERRSYGDSETYYPMPFLSKETFAYYKSAFDMDQFKIINLVSHIQRHVDQGISLITYVDNDASTRDLARYYTYAARKGIKSLYYTRPRKKDISGDVAECVSCSV